MKVCIPTVLRQHTGGNAEISVSGTTVGEAIDDLVQRHPQLRAGLLDETGNVVRFMGVFVNDRNIRDLDGKSTRLDERDEILLVPAIAGG